MKHEEVLYDFYLNKKLNESGLNEYISILLQEIFSLKQKIIDLEHKTQYGKLQQTDNTG